MSDKAPAFAFTTNIPVPCVIRFVDVRPGKPWTDPANGQRKQLPAQVSIKGTFNGVETIAFLKGKVWVNVKALVSAGVIDESWASQTDELEAVTANTSLPVLNGNVTATLHKGPKDKYENMLFTPQGGALPQAPKRITYTEARSAGPHIPDLDGPYEDSGPIHPARVPNVPPPTDADMPEWAEPTTKPDTAKRKAVIIRSYLDLFGYVKSQPEMQGQEGSVVQAVSATLWIDFGKRGLNS